ncbi:transcriptional regulator [Vibrio ishigakensis]|uniref:Transcriptional regulator n=1 Tax=Vibrio ishigakensis TaxID=1481914 RepID=A0A0B8Q5Y1_9VIBR|nr:transcriptional regulator [Vibrio ishigakensis]
MKEISALPIFATVVECKSFAEAARKLNLPTTTVSRKVQSLEQEIGGKLLNRSTRSLSLTELGEQVLPKARLIADTVYELSNEAQTMMSSPMGKLTISAPRALSQDLLAPLLAEFLNRYPNIKLDLRASNRFQNLAEDNIDFAFRLGPLVDSSLIAMKLSKVTYVLTAHKDAVSDELDHPSQLLEMPCIRAHIEGYILPWQFAKAGERYEINSEPAMLCDDFIVARTMTISGYGVSLLPASLYREQNMQDLKILLPDWIEQDKSLFMVYQDRVNLPQKSKLFIEFIKERQSWIESILCPSDIR